MSRHYAYKHDDVLLSSAYFYNDWMKSDLLTLRWDQDEIKMRSRWDQDERLLFFRKL